MPKSVEKAFTEILKEHALQGNEEEAKRYVQVMRKSGRYQQEVW
jgi:sulfite reductase alpha subunit-like flavoprotein